MTGVDAAAPMIGQARQVLPDCMWHVADMRTMALGTFDGLIAWNSFFHLTQSDQRAMFSVFERHDAPDAALMFTCGPRANEAIGDMFGEPLYHSSLDEDEYRSLLDQHGFYTIARKAEDPECAGHSIMLARKRAA